MVTQDSTSYLSDGEKLAAQLGAVTYDIWKCENGHAVLKVDYIKEGSEFCECEQCRNIIAHIVGHAIKKEADYSHKGSGYNHYACQYCKAEFDIRFIIPELIVSTLINSSNNRDSDRSSSSSSSSGSWGGGSSGGGGSGSNW